MRPPIPVTGLGIALVLASLCGTPAQSLEPIAFVPGPGGNPLPPNRDILWSEPPDLEGAMLGSEQILDFDYETELANDFWVDHDLTIGLARWWGGYYNYTPGDTLVTSFNLRFYFDGIDCLPGPLALEVIVPSNAHETLIYMQEGYPVYVYDHSLLFDVLQDLRYWFVPQAGDHPFPPQWGRLQSVENIGCDAAFRSAFFGVPDWELACTLPPVVPCDFSQEFEDAGGPDPVIPATWGDIKSLYR